MAEAVILDAGSLPADTILVSTQQQFDAAIAQLNGGSGGTVALSGGPYTLNINGMNFGGDGLVITSADSENPADIAWANVTNSSNITFQGLTFSTTEGLLPPGDHYASVRWASDISFEGNTFSGDATGMLSETGNPDYAYAGIILRDSQNVSAIDNYLENLGGGIGFLEISGLTLSGNELTGIQGDGFQGGGIENVLISENYMHDFFGSTQSINHSDMIQIWGTNAKILTSNVEISGNILDASGGPSYQGIFIRNEQFGQTSGASGGYYQNISVFDNIVHVADYGGINVDDTNGLDLHNNTVLWDQDALVYPDAYSEPVSVIPWISARNTLNGYLYDNVASSVTLNGEGLEEQNYFIEYNDASSPNYYQEHFINAGSSSEDLRDLMIKPDSPIYGIMGASGSWSQNSDEQVVAVMSPAQAAGDSMGYVFSADLSQVAAGTEGATYTWTFGDGTVLTGSEVYYRFSTPGEQQVSLTVTDAQGNEDVTTRTVMAEGYETFSLDFGGGSLLAPGAISLDGDGFTTGQISGATQGAYSLSSSSKLELDFDGLFNTQTFDLKLAFAMEHDGGSGTLLNIHDMLVLRVMSDGSLEFQVRNVDDWQTVRSGAGLVSGDQWNAVNIVYDAPAGTLDMMLNDQLVGSVDASGMTQGYTGHPLYLGGSFLSTAEAAIGGIEITLQPSSIWDDYEFPTGEVPPEVVEDPVLEEPLQETGEEPVQEAGEDPVQEAGEDPVVVTSPEPDTDPNGSVSDPEAGGEGDPAPVEEPVNTGGSTGSDAPEQIEDEIVDEAIRDIEDEIIYDQPSPEPAPDANLPEEPVDTSEPDVPQEPVENTPDPIDVPTSDGDDAAAPLPDAGEPAPIEEPTQTEDDETTQLLKRLSKLDDKKLSAFISKAIKWVMAALEAKSEPVEGEAAQTASATSSSESTMMAGETSLAEFGLTDTTDPNGDGIVEMEDEDIHLAA